MKQNVLEYNTIFQKEVEGGYSVWVPALPGCTTQGETFEEAMNNIKEAISLYLDNEEGAAEDAVDSRNQFMVPITIS